MPWRLFMGIAIGGFPPSSPGLRFWGYGREKNRRAIFAAFSFPALSLIIIRILFYLVFFYFRGLRGPILWVLK
jgi:hypothetical protein